MVHNPPWVAELVAETFDSVARQPIPAKWMPLFKNLRNSGAHLMSGDLEEYGCGNYGCVYPTNDPAVVLKVTADSTEAQFAAELARDLPLAVVVHYYMVMQPEDAKDPRGSDVFFLWRESANHVGTIVAYLDETRGTGDEASALINTQHKAAQAAYEAVYRYTHHPINGGGKRRLRKTSVQDIAKAISAWLATCEAMARQTRVPELRELGDGMVEAYGQQRILFGDVHAGNLGMVDRAGREHWVITDPGHVAVVNMDL